MKRIYTLLQNKLLLGAFLIIAFSAIDATFAVEYYLRADVTTKTMPDGVVVTMWGFAQDSDFNTEDGSVLIPGPALEVPPGDNTLIIHLKNKLTAAAVGYDGFPVSLVIPGQIAVMNPVRWGASPFPEYEGRVRSFTHETPPGNTTPVDYQWTNFKPGTYLYHSGTHPQVQVQMGLCGAVVKDSATGIAYPGYAYTNDVILLFSEIDPELHADVAAGTYGPGGTRTSTIDYTPRYFLINGVAYSSSESPVSAGMAGDSILLRFLNAGLETRVPVLQGYYLKLLAEDGNPMAHPRDSYSILLPAGKTMDGIFTPTQADIIPVYDRRLGLTNHMQKPGGMLTFLKISDTLRATLTVDLSGSGTGSVVSITPPNGIACPGDCSESYPLNTLVTLSAIPDPHATFVGWSDPGCPGTGDCTLSITEATTITATFQSEPDGIGAFINGRWYLDKNYNFAWNPGVDLLVSYGLATDIPIAGDFNGDGASEIGVYRNTSWYIDMNNNHVWDGVPTDAMYDFGVAGALPVVGDWNGDGFDEIGYFSAGAFFLDLNGNGIWDGRTIDLKYLFGVTGDLPVAGDWDGNGSDEIGVYRNGAWLLDFSANGKWDGAGIDRSYSFGNPNDLPAIGDWNGDGIDQIAVFRRGAWYIDFNGNGLYDGSTIDRFTYFGANGYKPVTGKWFSIAAFTALSSSLGGR